MIGPDGESWRRERDMQDDHDLRMYGGYVDEQPPTLPDWSLPAMSQPAVLVEMFGRDPLDPERGVAA